MAKKQYRWAIVHSHGHINHGYMCFTRRAVIDKIVREHRAYKNWQHRADLTDAQFWRLLKRLRGWNVRKVEVRVSNG